MSKKPRGNIHKIREFELEKINLVDEFDILQIVGEGWFGKILLVEHRASGTEMVLKAVPKPYVSLRDFYREFHYGLHLGIHRNIVTTYDVAFETAGFYVFTQEYAPLGDLTSNVTDTGVGETYSKRVAKQIASALDYMHAKDIVHRDVKLDNVLIYRSDFTRVKLCDFGESYQSGSTVERRNEWLPYSPPEVLEVKPESTYTADPSHDVWQFGIVIFVCLTGCLPWQKAASDDPRYVRYLAWHGTIMLPIRRTPKLFKLLTSRAQRMFKRFLEPKADRRPKNLADLTKFLDDRWLAKTAEKEMAEYETDELCPSMYSFHSSPDEKHRLLYTLAECGIETNVDRQSKKNRIKDWIESSIITEEDEEENDDANSTSPSSSVSREPVAGHISSIRTPVVRAKEIKTTLKDATQKHFDPRTGALQSGPSEMGTQPLMGQRQSVSPSMSNVSTLNNGDSICGSLLTLGSRQDMISSNADLYNSDINLNSLGEQLNHRFNDKTLSNGSLLTASANDDYNALTRLRADGSRATMFASSPAIDSLTAYNTNYNTTNYLNDKSYSKAINVNNSNVYNAPDAAAVNKYGMNNLNSKVDNSNKSVTFTGLTNAFQSLAQIPMQNGDASSKSLLTIAAPMHNNSASKAMPANYNQQQYTASTYFNRQQNDSQVKDSAYGSTEVSEVVSRRVPSYNTNGNMKTMNINTTGVATTTSVRTQTSQQRQYSRTLSSSMKDTAYDRVAVKSNTKARR